SGEQAVDFRVERLQGACIRHVTAHVGIPERAELSGRHDEITVYLARHEAGGHRVGWCLSSSAEAGLAPSDPISMAVARTAPSRRAEIANLPKSGPLRAGVSRRIIRFRRIITVAYH